MSSAPSAGDGRDGSSDRAREWDARYEAGTTGWDLGRPAPPLVAWLSEHPPRAGTRVLVPGCGRGHDTRAWARAGASVTGVDFSPRALSEARELAVAEALDIEWVEADVSRLPSAWDGRFDAVWEHTCLCAIPPDLRGAYLDELVRVLRPGGRLVALLWAHGREGGPPYSMDESIVRPLLEPRFSDVSFTEARDSVAERQPERLWVARRPTT